MFSNTKEPLIAAKASQNRFGKHLSHCYSSFLAHNFVKQKLPDLLRSYIEAGMSKIYIFYIAPTIEL